MTDTWTQGQKNNHKLKNIYINATSQAAIFVGGSITKIANLGVTGEISSKGTEVAGISVGGGVSLIENCWNKAEIYGNSTYAGGTGTYAAGICTQSSKVKNCYNMGNVTNDRATPGGTAGGIVAHWRGGIVENCYNTGNITGKYYAGGIVGLATTGVRNCYNIGNINGSQAGRNRRFEWRAFRKLC